MTKKLFCIVLCVLLLAVSVTPVLAEESYNRFGDLNNDGDTDAIDYMWLKRYVLGTFEPSQQAWYRADVNYDGTVDATDYMILKREVLGTYDRPIIRGNVDEMTDGQLYGHIHRMLGYDRPEGKIEVVFTDGNISQAAEVFASLGLTGSIYNTFTIEGVKYGYASAECDESEIREILFALLRDERVFSASPETYDVPA